MATVALTASPTQLDAGTTYDLVVLNSGSSTVHVQVDSGNNFDQRLSPGQSIVVYPHGLAVTAYARSGSGQVTVTTQTNPQGTPSAGSSVAYGEGVDVGANDGITVPGDGTSPVLPDDNGTANGAGYVTYNEDGTATINAAGLYHVHWYVSAADPFVSDGDASLSIGVTGTTVGFLPFAAALAGQTDMTLVGFTMLAEGCTLAPMCSAEVIASYAQFAVKRVG